MASFPTMTTFDDSFARLRDLAREKGYRLKKGPIRDSWFLTEQVTEQLALGDRGSTAFSTARAIKFLEAVPERPYDRHQRPGTTKS